jgi:hypothetical protein
MQSHKPEAGMFEVTQYGSTRQLRLREFLSIISDAEANRVLHLRPGETTSFRLNAGDKITIHRLT